MSGHGVERRVKVWVLDQKSVKVLGYFSANDYKSEINIVYTSFMDVIRMDILV